jgi:hypothetical protein
MLETKVKPEAPIFNVPDEFILRIGSLNYGRYNKEGYWLDYFSIKTREDMFFSIMKCCSMPERFRIVERSSGKIVYGCGAS